MSYLMSAVAGPGDQHYDASHDAAGVPVPGARLRAGARPARLAVLLMHSIDDGRSSRRCHVHRVCQPGVFCKSP
eukprot:4492639-Pyramimonas_sp.AAC.1